jgi:ABC-type uncharacterized transport system ATPase subunit
MIRVILEGLVKRFGTVAAVDGVSLELRPGEITYVLGPSPGSSRVSRPSMMARFISAIRWSNRWLRTSERREWCSKTWDSGQV